MTSFIPSHRYNTYLYLKENTELFNKTDAKYHSKSFPTARYKSAQFLLSHFLISLLCSANYL